MTFLEYCCIIQLTKGVDTVNSFEFGKFLSQLRKEKGLTQLQLAEKLNVTDKAVSRWETGKNYPDIEIFEDLSKIFDVSVSELLEGKRIEKENLFSVSEEHVVDQIKKNKKSGKNYRIIICIALIISLVLGYIALKENGVFDGVIYNKIPCYSNDILTIMNNIDGYITQRPESDGEFIINNGFFFMERDKTSNDILYLSGTCENGRGFYVNTMYEEANRGNNHCFIGEYRENMEPAEGIPFKDLKRIVSQLDLSLLPDFAKYQIDVQYIDVYDNFNINSNDYQKGIQKYIFRENVLSAYTEDILNGKYLLITVWGFDNGHGKSVAYIYYEI